MPSLAHKPTTLPLMPRYILHENLIVVPPIAAVSDRCDRAQVLADISSANILDDSSLHPSFFNWPASPPAPARRIFWSGWTGESIFSLDHHTWSQDSWARLDRWCDTALPHLQRNNASACLRPHTRHILSDPQSCLTFLRRHENQPFELLLEPAAFLTPSMLPRADDHLTRAMDALAYHPAVRAILLTNLSPSPDDPDLLVPTPRSRGVLPLQLLSLIESKTPPNLPVITLP
jgi:hypothetical protein